jgi:hypothetical protein
MSPKFMSFLAMCWFISTFICLILEGAYFGAAQNSIINDLSIMTTISLGPLIVPVFNVNFAQGIMRLLLWDYSFYTGGWVIIRYFWVCTLSSGAMWGIIQAFIWLYGQAISFITQLV